MKISVETTINSSKDKVWSAISDIENAPEMISGIIGLEVLEKPASGLLGLKWRETRKMFGKEADETMWITDCMEGEFYQTRAENHGAIYKSRLSLEAIESSGSDRSAKADDAIADRTKLTMTFEGEAESFLIKVVSAIMSLFMKKSMIKMLETDLADIKAYVEAKQN